MNIFEFVFSFLYTRDWYTGKMELSRPRVALFSAALFLILLGVVIASILQAPIEYVVTENY
jgi:hypothetical protein